MNSLEKQSDMILDDYLYELKIKNDVLSGINTMLDNAIDKMNYFNLMDYFNKK